MIIGHSFAWGHVPKTGGNAVATLFGFFPHLIAHTDDIDSNEKHTPFRARSSSILGKDLILNIRRMPAWLLSYAHHKASEGLYPIYEPMRLDSSEAMARSTQPDQLMNLFTDHGALHIHRWFRTECLTTDFLSFVCTVANVPEAQRDYIRSHGKINARSYDRRIHEWFTDEQLARMYANNPMWSAIEEEVYGGTLLESSAGNVHGP
jgi:hypothetical protein